MNQLAWRKVYVGPFERKEAVALAEGIREVANPEVNLIHDCRIRKRRNQPMFDVYYLSEQV